MIVLHTSIQAMWTKSYVKLLLDEKCVKDTVHSFNHRM